MLLSLPGWLLPELVASVAAECPQSPSLAALPAAVPFPKKGRRPRKAKAESAKDKKLRESRQNLFSWLNDAAPQTRSEYAVHHRLDYFTTPLGEMEVKGALALWAHPVTREILCGGLLAGTPLTALREMVRSRAGVKVAAFARQADIEAFQWLFWDFSHMSIVERGDWLRRWPTTRFAAVAEAEGLESMLFRLGLGEIKTDFRTMVSTIQQTAFASVLQMKASGVFQLSQLNHALDIVMRAEDRLQATTGEAAGSLLEGFGIQLLDSEALDIPAFEDVLHATEREQRLDEIRMALGEGAISTEDAGRFTELVERDPFALKDVVRSAIKAHRARQGASSNDVA